MVLLNKQQFDSMLDKVLELTDEHYVLAVVAEECRNRFPTSTPEEENQFAVRFRLSAKIPNQIELERAGYLYIFGNANPPHDGYHIYEANDKVVHTKEERIWCNQIKIMLNCWIIFNIDTFEIENFALGKMSADDTE